ncbi:MAG: rhodanese-like domain-containing protein [Leeuwenhoekiella sp.]|nr:rhodanese-like domain-containing protein [Leeuwenhoekiella sp.]
MKRIFSSLFTKPKLHKLLKNKLSKDVALISVQELNLQKSKYMILDTRTQEEFEISHIPKAQWVNENPKQDLISQLIPDPNTPVVVYCSLGIRSNEVARQLLSLNYKEVYNLYGGIFDWKDNGFDVVNPLGESTEEIHTFSKQWSTYLKTGIKIY